MVIGMNPEVYEKMSLELQVFIEEVNNSCEVMKNAASMCMEIAETDVARVKEVERLHRSIAHYQEVVEAAYELMGRLQEERTYLMDFASRIEEL